MIQAYYLHDQAWRELRGCPAILAESDTAHEFSTSLTLIPNVAAEALERVNKIESDHISRTNYHVSRP